MNNEVDESDEEFALVRYTKMKNLLGEYGKDKRLNSNLMSDASLAVYRLDSHGLDKLRPGYVSVVRQNIDTYREIYKVVEEIEQIVNMIEMVHWFDRPDLVCRWKQLNDCQMEQMFVDRKDRKPPFEVGPNAIQTYYSNSKDRGHSFECKNYKALLWGTAGRVLITLQNESAELTMIYDESSMYPRSGIQNIEGTGEEVLKLAGAFLKMGAKFIPDGKVGIA